MKLLATILALSPLLCGQWVMSSVNNAVAPDVHSVRADEKFVYVESAGISLHSFGALEANQYDPPTGVRTLQFRLPGAPQKAAQPMSTPLGIVGLFVTGVPIYNFIGTNSYRNQNIWHQDAVRATQANLPAAGMRSSVVGFALDGFPIRAVAGMRSSYRLRAITKRSQLPDGTLLTPSQEGPDVGPNFPRGYFAEDYEYAPGSGDLDQSNGAVVDGAYSYFLTPTWPYLIGPHYYGDAPLDFPARTSVLHSGRVDLWADVSQFEANRPVRMTLAFGARFLEQVHEKPVHLIVVSKDMAEFDHIHPEPVPGDAFSVTHTFARAGDYWIYADYTAPGEPPSVARFTVHVGGTPGKPAPLRSDAGVQVKLDASLQIEANRDVPLAFTLTDAKTGQPVTDLEPWLGAWGHIMIVSEDGSQFIHAHPLENAQTADPLAPHTHTAPSPGPSPFTIRTQIGFELSGTYKLWFQFQRNGEISTFPFELNVSAGRPILHSTAAPSDAIPVAVSRTGFAPDRVEVPGDKAIRLAFIRLDAQNCAREVVFPELGLRKALPVGQPVVVEVPAKASGEFHFACGMGMYQGAVVIR